MPKYKVKDTKLFHGKKDDKVATEYNPGDTIELTEQEAAPIMHHLEPVEEEKRKKKTDE